MKITYIGYNIEELQKKVKRGDFSSQLLYGAIELEKRNINISYFSPAKKGVINLMKDIIRIQQNKSDVLFFPYITEKFYIMLYIAKKIGFLKREKLIGILHYTPIITSTNKFYIKHIYKTFNKIYFHSPLNMEECIEQKIVSKNQAEQLYWGSELSYFNSIHTGKEKERFISTGLENRDYKTLIDAFSQSQQELDIYLYFNSFQKNVIQNSNKYVKIHYIKQENINQYYTAQKTKEAICVVVPINDKGLKYCTGHTSIIEAMALGKPIIVTDNPYHPIDVEKEQIGIKVKPHDIVSWQHAINYMISHKEEMNKMGKRGRLLAESTYNIDKCAEQIYNYVITLTHK